MSRQRNDVRPAVAIAPSYTQRRKKLYALVMAVTTNQTSKTGCVKAQWG